MFEIERSEKFSIQFCEFLDIIGYMELLLLWFIFMFLLFSEV